MSEIPRYKQKQKQHLKEKKENTRPNRISKYTNPTETAAHTGKQDLKNIYSSSEAKTRLAKGTVKHFTQFKYKSQFTRAARTKMSSANKRECRLNNFVIASNSDKVSGKYFNGSHLEKDQQSSCRHFWFRN